MTRIGVIGLGVMGAPMAVNLANAGFEVAGFDRRQGAAERLVSAGGHAATSLLDVFQGADVVITVLPDSPDVEQVVFGDDGLLRHPSAGLLYIDCSTIRPETSIKVAKAARELGVRPLDAPVSGGQQGAETASLSIMVGGKEGDFESAKPVLAALGKTVVHVGGDGAGQTVKAANQLLVAGIIELVSEALVLIEASGIDPGPALEVLRGGLAGNRVLDLKSVALVARDFTPGFRIDLHHKDMGIVLAAARQVDVCLPVTGLIAQLVGAARARGGGMLDHTALLGVVEQLSGRSATNAQPTR